MNNIYRAQCYFPAAVVKGIIEHNDGSAYFGSLGGYLFYVEQAIENGWVTMEQGKLCITPKGKSHYDKSGLANFTKMKGNRAYFWDWSSYKENV